MLIARTHGRNKPYKLVGNGDNDDDQSFAVCAAYVREREIHDHSAYRAAKS